MKNFLNRISFFLIGLVLLGSCDNYEDEILGLKPTDRFSEADVWTSGKSANEFLNQCYAGMGSLSINGLGNAENLPAGLTDMGVIRGNQGNWNFQSGSIVPTSTGTANIWEGSYVTIRNTNLFLENIDRVPDITQQEKSLMTAQARFIRAYRYMFLVNYYSWWEGPKNGVPLLTKSYSPGEDVIVDRAGYDEVVNFIISELDEIEDVLPLSWPDAEWGKITKGACLAMKSRMLLYKASKRYNPGHDTQEWVAASDAAKAVIDMSMYELIQIDNTKPPIESYKEYADIFLHPNNEMILSQPTYMAPGFMYGKFEIRNAPNGYGGEGACGPTQEIVNKYQNEDGEDILDASGNPINGYDPQNPFVNRETRFYATIVYNGRDFRGRQVETFMPDPDNPSDMVIPGKDSRHPTAIRYRQTSETGFWLYKFMNESIAFDQPSNTPVILFRHAEAFLNYAEAQFELGNEDVARANINIIRNRVGLPDLDTSLTGTALRDAIRHERTIELAFEQNHRFCDERRWEILPETFVTLWRLEAFKDNNGNIRYVGDQTMALPRVFSEKMYSFPIPDREIQRAPHLNQNPGY